jgi:hypothetical protein
LAQAIDDTTNYGITHGHIRNATRAFDGGTFTDAHCVSEDGDSDVVLLEIENQTENRAWKFDKLAGHDSPQAMHAGDAVTAR